MATEPGPGGRQAGGPIPGAVGPQQGGRGPSTWPALVPLRFANFRYLWVGTVLTQTSRWMDQVAQGWLIYQLTDSPLWVGLAGGARGVPMLLLGLPGGLLVDRVDRRMLLLAGEAAITLLSLAQAVLVLSGLIAPWHLLATSLVAGAAMAVGFPARQAIIPSVIPREYTGNAVAVSTAGQNATRVMGPSLAGLVIGAVGVGWSFCLQTVVAALALWSTWGLRLAPLPLRARRSSNVQAMLAGLRYVSASPSLGPQMLLAVVPVFLAIPFQQLMPVFARDILGVGPEGLGLLLAANGGGAVVAAVVLASMDPQRRGPLQLASAALLGVLVALFALSTSLWLSIVLAALAGAAQALYLATNNTLILLLSPEELRGRILSLYNTAWAALPLGTLAQGALAEWIGAPLAVALGGGLCTALIGVIALRWPSVYKL